MLTRRVALLLCAAAVLHAQDALEIVRRSIALEDRNAELSRNYTYLARQEQRETDSAGKIVKIESDTFDIMLLDGSPYRRHVAHNDRPLHAKDEAKEQEKLRAETDVRRKETPEGRKQRIEDAERRRRRQRDPYKEIPNAFNLKLAGEETIGGVAAYVIEATPKPGYQPQSRATRFFPHIKGRLWIARQDYEIIKIDAETLESVSLAGFLLRMSKGSHIVIEASRVNNEVWMPTRAMLKGSVRIALVKVLRGEYIFTFDYRKASPGP
jgi:hypothetical protein